ncbi:MAG TPA: hypothetical protein VFL76_03155 [Edaphocola sp.]|nr:hypothetical protein [Edaphocola sp.]
MTTDFYYIQRQEIKDDECYALFYLDPGHAIFKGHFPGKPVLPGVCMIHVIKELFINAKGSDALLKTVQQVKFLEIIVPDEQTPLTLHMNWTMAGQNEWMVQAELKKEGKAFCKFKGIFSPVA